MATKRYKTLIVETDGVELDDQTEFALETSDAVQSMGAMILIPSTQAAANSTLQLTLTSNTSQIFTGTTAGQIVKLPNATTLLKGRKFEIYNQSSQNIAIKNFDGTTILTLGPTSIAYVTLEVNTTTAGGWICWQIYLDATGILEYHVTSSTPFTTSSTTDVVITGFTLTPVSGQYGIWYNASVSQAASGANHDCTVFAAGTQIADSRRNVRGSASNQAMIDSTMTVFTLNGSQAIDVRVKTNTGSFTVNDRTLILIRLGSS